MGEQTFFCTCGAAFESKRDLWNHQKDQHGVMTKEKKVKESPLSCCVF